MKKVITAKNAGFCFGVKRAVDAVYEQAEKGTPIYTYGPIIHNEEVVADLESKGVRVIETEAEITKNPGAKVIIRSHGIGRAVQKKLEENFGEVIDATCPFVKKIHKIVSEQSREGRIIIIVGNEHHPEVEGIKGWADGEVYTVDSVKNTDIIPDFTGKKLCIVAQTTFNYNKFQDVVEKFSKKGYDIYAANTICNATQVRQEEAKQIAAQVDAMIVIGGSRSSNTQKLFEICKSECENTYYIQTLADLIPESFQSVDSVGITAGASTPKCIIEEVHTNVRVKF